MPDPYWLQQVTYGSNQAVNYFNLYKDNAKKKNKKNGEIIYYFFRSTDSSVFSYEMVSKSTSPSKY